MLNRFRDMGEQPIPHAVERFMTSWADTEGVLRDAHEASFLAVARAGRRCMSDRDLNFQVVAEAALNDVVPELVTAIKGLRSSLDDLRGWKIDWRNYERGDTIGFQTASTEDAARMVVVRGPDEYEPMSGWVVGSNIGPSPITFSLETWVEISFAVERTTGVHMPLEEMFEIELSPPTDTGIPRPLEK